MMYYNGNELMYDNGCNGIDSPCRRNDYRTKQLERPELPTGVPTGPSPTPLIPQTPNGNQVPQTIESTAFMPGFLKTQIGKNMRVEFLIGTNGPLVDRVGRLLGVGTSYILLRPTESNDTLLCDLYSIKFVTIY